MNRAGFTLVEVVVATAVTAIIVTLATSVVATVGDTLYRVEEAALDHHREMNSLRLIQQVAPSVGLTRQRGARFLGSPRAASFPAMSWSTDGWLAPVEVRLEAGESGLTLDVSGSRSVRLFEDRQVRLEYLVPGSEGRAWLTQWESGVTPPAALRFILTGPGTDTVDRFVILMGGSA